MVKHQSPKLKILVRFEVGLLKFFHMDNYFSYFVSTLPDNLKPTDGYRLGCKPELHKKYILNKRDNRFYYTLRNNKNK